MGPFGRVGCGEEHLPEAVGHREFYPVLAAGIAVCPADDGQQGIVDHFVLGDEASGRAYSGCESPHAGNVSAECAAKADTGAIATVVIDKQRFSGVEGFGELCTSEGRLTALYNGQEVDGGELIGAGDGEAFQIPVEPYIMGQGAERKTGADDRIGRADGQG